MKKVIGISCMFLVVLVSFIFTGVIIRNKTNIKGNLDLVEQQNVINRGEVGKISDLNFYQKLHQKKDINALIVGDSIAQSTGTSNFNEKWINVLTKDVQKKYRSTITTDPITGGSTTGIRAWVELNNAKLTKQYDVVFICLGQNDQFNIKPKQFRMFYESIIIKLKKLNPNIEIIPIIESSFRQYNEYSKVIEDLAEHYNLQYADTVGAFNNSGKLYSYLSNDLVHPNGKGYVYYAKTIEKVINDNYLSNKKTDIYSSVLYNNTKKLTDFVFDDSPDLNNGFTVEGGFIGNKISENLTFNTTKSVAIIHFLRKPNGGKFKVFIDDKFIKEINTNSTFQVSYSDLIAYNFRENHKISIEISYIIKKGSVKILGLVTN
ncbi:SGNH/GDSL hydrolase family protein [Clostridium estertheticum]|uniref:SGNH/GDSL hydrolase family protein n=1 Tax=Clostridium estertheticum TaxID=238834 RepID=A0A7Y3ST66_9CLOT|nr:SGNH/GDSL hydrolase family protein [Clostridium estertheticum]NNU74888.1 SGNH/GDSL hydrolase family protein [Clostridium estertheticum]WBL47347.1 SGNH/GDSL hydrolase family protein [Clostridium estertheticum]